MHLTAADWARIETLFPLAAELSGEARVRFLDRECAGNERVRRELEAMLAAEATQDSLFDAPITLTSTENRPAVEGLAAGTRLGSWKIRSLIGTGGMGEVYLAERADGAYAMTAAIKLLKRELYSYANAQRFLRERRVLARLSHPNIARVLDAGTTDDGRPFLVMEYAPGARITDHARERMLAPRQIAQLMVAVAEAVAEAHRHGVVHRDLKPANVIVSDPQQVKLLDFGIARLLDESDADTSSAVPMTPAYAAPEQILNGELTPATDVYALGVMLFQLLTHTLPHLREGLPLPLIAAGLRDEAVERPSRVVLAGEGPFYAEARQKRAQEIEGDLDRIVLKALHADPRQRHADAAEFADDLRRCLEGGSERKYWAFISYSHQDEAWAQWLHKSIETWRVPGRLVGRTLGDEIVPRRLFPVFRDRDELPSSHELGAVINQALRQSRNLIVVCSPRSATSRWVNEEIKAFRALGRSQRVFCLIVDGEPHASAKPEIAFSECFPPALREEGFEPIAADARERKDGKAGARLKLLAGLLNVGLDELKQREKQRQLRQRLLAALGALAIVGVLAGTVQGFLAARADREREILTDRLVENGRQELLEGRNGRAAVYLTEALGRGRDTVPLRFMLRQAMRAVDALTPIRTRHGGTDVRRAAFSADGTRFVLIVETAAGTVAKVYDASSGAELLALAGAPRHPRIVEFLPDGRHLLVSGFESQEQDTTESQPRTVVWRFEQPTPLLDLPGNSGRFGNPLSRAATEFVVAAPSGGIAVHSLQHPSRSITLESGRFFEAASFSADGRYLLTADRDGRLDLWSGDRYTRVGELTGFKGKVIAAVAFTPDGSRAFALSRGGDFGVWDVTSRKPTLAFALDPGFVTDIRFSGDGRRFLSLGTEGYKVWSAARGVLLFSLSRVFSWYATGALSHDGNLLFTADTVSSASEIWSVRTRLRLATLDLHTGGVSAVAIDPRANRVLLASNDGTAELWSTAINPVWSRQFSADWPYRVRFSKAASQLLVAAGTSSGGKALRLDPLGGQPAIEHDTHGSYVFDIAEHPAQDQLLTASADGTAALWNGAGLRLATLDHRPHAVQQARFSPDGSRIVTLTGSHDAALQSGGALWDGSTATRLAALSHGGIINGFAFSADGMLLATASDDALVKLWDLRVGAPVKTFDGHAAAVWSVAFSSDGQRLLTAGQDHTVRIVNISDGDAVAVLSEPMLGTVFHAQFSPDEKRVALATQAGKVWVWTPQTGALLSLNGHQSAAYAVRFLHAGKVLVSSGHDGTIRAWDPERGLPLAIVGAPGGVVTSMDVNADQSWLAAASQAFSVGLWDIGLEQRDAGALAARLRCGANVKISDGALIETEPLSSCAAAP